MPYYIVLKTLTRKKAGVEAKKKKRQLYVPVKGKYMGPVSARRGKLSAEKHKSGPFSFMARKYRGKWRGAASSCSCPAYPALFFDPKANYWRSVTHAANSLSPRHTPPRSPWSCSFEALMKELSSRPHACSTLPRSLGSCSLEVPLKLRGVLHVHTPATPYLASWAPAN